MQKKILQQIKKVKKKSQINNNKIFDVDNFYCVNDIDYILQQF